MRPTGQADRLAWFNEAKFGLFIHWGLYAVPAGEWGDGKNYGEWIMLQADIPVQRYEGFAREFNPVKFDAKEWVSLAQDAGMKDLVITDFPARYSQIRKPFAVGTPVARRPLHRSQRAEFPHWAPASGQKAEALLRIGMHDADRREPAPGNPEHALPGDVSLLAAATERQQGVVQTYGAFGYRDTDTRADPETSVIQRHGALAGRIARRESILRPESIKCEASSVGETSRNKSQYPHRADDRTGPRPTLRVASADRPPQAGKDTAC